MAFCVIPLMDGKSVKPAAHSLLKKARKLGNRVTAVMIHCGIKEERISLDADDIISIQLTEEKWPLARHHIDAFLQTQVEGDREHEPILFMASPLANEIAGGLAVLLDRPIAGSLMDASMEGNHLLLKKEIYGGKACLYEERAISSVMTFDPAYLPPEKPSKSPGGHIQHIHVSSTDREEISFIENKELSWEEIQLTEAACVIGIGRGVYQSLDRFSEIEELADLLNAPIGGSKVADELGIIPRERRVGSSGVSLDQAAIYIAIGISGSSQHLEGIKNVQHVLAINNDSAAAIFNRSDIGIMSPYEEVLPLLISKIKEISGVNHHEEHTSYPPAGI